MRVIDTNIISRLIAPYLEIDVSEGPENIDHYNLRMLALQLKEAIDGASKQCETYCSNVIVDDSVMSRFASDNYYIEGYKKFTSHELYQKIAESLEEDKIGTIDVTEINKERQNHTESLIISVLEN